MQMLIVTTDEVPGRVIKKTLGLASGWGSGGVSLGRDRRCHDAALAELIEEAEQLGADAVVALRFSAFNDLGGHYRFFACGTAVKLA